MTQNTIRVQTLIIGGGQAGLSVGYYLAKRGLPFLILDAHQRTGDSWRQRWDSLRLFTPARYSSLPGFRFPARGDSFPSKDEMADYLESYARRFQLPVQHGVRVKRLSRENGRFIAAAGDVRFESQNVVVAMADYQKPRIPTFAGDLDPGILQIHSHYYSNPSQLLDGPVLVVGAGNSAADIAIEIARSTGRKVWMSGKESGHVPFRIETALARFFLVRLVKFVGHQVLNVNNPIGRRVRPKLLSKAAPLVRVKPQDLIEAGIERVPRVTGVRDGQPLLAGDRSLDARNIVWCTGYHPGFPWIDLPVFGEDGRPVHECGVVDRVPGLYFVGLHFLRAMSSASLIGIGRDAEYIAGVIRERSGKSQVAAEWESTAHEDHDSRRLFRHAEDPALLSQAGRPSGRNLD